MAERTHHAGEQEAARLQDAARDAPDWAAPTSVVIAGWTGHAVAGSRGSEPAIARAIRGLQATAGNGAVAQLLATASSRRPVVPAPTRSVHTEADGAASPAVGAREATVQRAGAPTPGPSWTKIGPPSPSSFSVSGTLRQVATALEARTEAGATITSSALDSETYEPENGTERITAARFTVNQKVELPAWSDKGAATKNQQAEWDRFSAAIKSHEDGHVATDKKSYANAHTKILGKTPTDGNTTWGNLDTQAKTDNDAFDAANDHGRSAGTAINANIDEVTKVP